MEKRLASPNRPAAIGYVRVSSKKQRDEGNSLDDQREAIIRHAVLSGFELVDIFADEGISGGKDEKRRPGIAAALDSIRSGRAFMLIVKHANRLSRDSDFAGYLKVEVRKSGGRLEIIDEAKNDPIRAAVDKMLAELERIRGSQRMKFVHAAKKSKALWTGAVPFGYRLGEDHRGDMVRNPPRRSAGAAIGRTGDGAGLRSHILSLRTQMDAALALLGIPRPAYTDPSLTTSPQGDSLHRAAGPHAMSAGGRDMRNANHVIRIILAVAVLSAFALVATSANGAEQKFRAAAGPEPVIGRYLVTLESSVAEDLVHTSAEALARAYSGQLELYTSSDARTFAVTMLPSRARTLSTDPRVRQVVEIPREDDRQSPPQQSPSNSLGSHHLVPSALDGSASGFYTYDGTGNIKAIGGDSFDYDVDGRLMHATVRGNFVTYAYDAFGNRESSTRATGAADCVGGCEATVTVNHENNHLGEQTYDEAGNVKTGFGAVYTYDGTGMVTEATVATDDREFVYTADDERLAVRRGSSWTWSVRDQGDKVLREFTSLETSASPLTLTSHTWSKDYVWRDGLLLASVSPGSSTTTTYHYHLDHLGTPRFVTDGNHMKIAEHEYYPFGAEMNIIPHESAAELMKFTGHERDIVAADNASVDYMHARYYNGNLGRFLELDPVGGDQEYPQSWNRYSYVRNNPIGNTDPNGKICIPCAAWGAFAAVTYESIRQVKSGEPVNNKRLFAAVGMGAVAGATLGAAAEAAPVVYNAALANPAAVATTASLIGGAMTPGPEGEMPKLENLAASEVRFTQDSVKNTFKDGRSVQELIQGLKSGTVKPGDVPAIRVFMKDGNIFSLDNRPLYALQQAGVKTINAVWATAEELARELPNKLTTVKDGLSIVVRGE